MGRGNKPIVTRSTGTRFPKAIVAAVFAVMVVSAGLIYYFRYPLPNPPDGGDKGVIIVLSNSTTIDGGGGGDDWALGMAYDSEHDTLYACGHITKAGEGKNGVIWKLASDLVPISNVTFGGPGGDDRGSDLALDDNGRLFVVGYVVEPGQGQNIWLARYGLNLTLEKCVTVNGPDNSTDEGYGLLLDTAGMVYITGTVTVPVTGYDIFIAKYDTDLNLQRSVILNGPANKTDKGRFLLLDGMGNLFVSGSMSQPGTGYDIWLGKFNTDLELLDQTIIAGPGPDEDKGYDIVMDEAGFIYATGTMTEPGESYNIWLAKFETGLNLLNNVTINGSGNGEDTGYTMVLRTVEGVPCILQTGVYTEASGGANIMVAVYNMSFFLMGRYTINGSANAYDSGFGIIDGPDESFFVSGFVTETVGAADAWFGRFRLVLIVPP